MSEKLRLVQKEVDATKDIMMKNMEDVIKRGDNLEELQRTTDQLQKASVTFERKAKETKRTMCMKNCKMTAIIIGVVLVIIALIVLFVVKPWDNIGTTPTTAPTTPTTPLALMKRDFTGVAMTFKSLTKPVIDFVTVPFYSIYGFVSAFQIK